MGTPSRVEKPVRRREQLARRQPIVRDGPRRARRLARPLEQLLKVRVQYSAAAGARLAAAAAETDEAPFEAAPARLEVGEAREADAAAFLVAVPLSTRRTADGVRVCIFKLLHCGKELITRLKLLGGRRLGLFGLRLRLEDVVIDGKASLLPFSNLP